MKPCVVMPYAFGVNNSGRPDAEARVRLDRAIQVGCDLSRLQNPLPTMFLGAGMPERTQSRGADSLAASMASYLKAQGWPSVQHPKGYSTVTETLALREYLKINDLVEIHFVTSWWHLPRVWIICKILFGLKTSMRFHAASSSHKGCTLLYDILREILALPHSAFMAWRAAKRFG